MNLNALDWLQICADGQTTPCIQPVQVGYLVALLIGAVLLAIIGRRARDFTTAVLSLMAVAIAINIAVGSIVYALRLPIYLDSIGTVLVGALAGPWAGALTGILSNLIWSILPIPGGASPTAAFFAPVAGVIGLMAGFWASRGVFQFRSDDARAGGFLSLAAGFVGAAVALLIVQNTIGLTLDLTSADSQNRFVLVGLGIIAVGVIVAWIAGRTVFDLRASDPRIRTYLVGATAISAFVLVVALFRLVFGPTGYFSAVNGKDPDGDGPLGPLFGGADLSFLAFPDPQGLIAAIVLGLIVGTLAFMWARRGRARPALPGLDRRGDDRPGRGDDVGAHRGRCLRGRDRRRHRPAGRGVPDARAQRPPVGPRAGPDQRPARQDDQLHRRLPHPGRAAGHRPDDVQPRRGDGRRMTSTA